MDRERERSFQDVLQCQQTKQLPDIYHYPNKNDRIIQSAFETSQTVIFAIQFLIHFLREKSSKSSNRKNKSKVSELKAEQQQLDGLCLALRRAVHAEGLIMEVWAPKGPIGDGFSDGLWVKKLRLAVPCRKILGNTYVVVL